MIYTHNSALPNSSRVSDEQCVMIMSVRKGKRLISRLLPFLPSPQASAVVMAIARNLPALAKKDKQDQVTLKCVENMTRTCWYSKGDNT